MLGIVGGAPVGFIKLGDRLEKDPDRRVQAAIRLADAPSKTARGSSAEPTSTVLPHQASTCGPVPIRNKPAVPAPRGIVVTHSPAPAF